MREGRRLVLFNNKGGVGKTTLVANLAFAFSEAGHRVLLVDGDPQGNLTSYLIEESVVNDLLDNSDTAGGRTLWSAVKPLAEASGGVATIEPIEVRDNIWLLPGDIRLAEFEAELASFWGECFQRRVRGFRGTQALAGLVGSIRDRVKADVVIYDCGPNIGALTRVILLDADYFAIPAAYDLFSTRAIKTVGHTLSQWIQSWAAISELAPPDLVEFPGQPRLVGYIAQRFRVYGGLPSTEFARMGPTIERAIREDVVEVLSRLSPTLTSAAGPPLALPEIKDFGSVATSAQRKGVPFWQVENTSETQRTEARAVFHDLCAAISKRMGLDP